MNEVIKKLIDTADLYRNFLQQDFVISISDKEKYLKVINTETLKFPFVEGASINEAGFDYVLKNIEKTGKSVVNIVPKEITGNVTVKSIISPIYDGREVVGYFSVTFNIEKEANMEQITNEITGSIEVANDSAHKIVNSVDKLNGMMIDIENWTAAAEESIQLSNKATELIKGIAAQSNLLGLNAAIEASRSSGAGNGFAVVASEMRKLAGQSKDTAQQVETALKEVEKSITIVLEAVKNARKVSEEEFVEIRQISDMVENISAKSKELVEYSKQ